MDDLHPLVRLAVGFGGIAVTYLGSFWFLVGRMPWQRDSEDEPTIEQRLATIDWLDYRLRRN